MDKILVINHGTLVKGHVLFPTLLFAFMVQHYAEHVTFIWPFIILYSVEKILPFFIDDRIKLTSWKGMVKVYSILAMIGGILAIIGLSWNLEWVASIAAALIGIGIAGTALAPTYPLKLKDINLKQINFGAEIEAIMVIILFSILLSRFSAVVAFAFYDLLLLIELFYSWKMVEIEEIPRNLKPTIEWRTVAALIASMLGKISSRIVLPLTLILLIGLALMMIQPLYLLGTAISALSAILLTKWANQMAHDRYHTSSAKLGVFGALCNQLTLFGILGLFSSFEFNSNKALLAPYIMHQGNLHYAAEMLWVRAIMFGIFVLTAVVVYFYERKLILVKK